MGFCRLRGAAIRELDMREYYTEAQHERWPNRVERSVLSLSTNVYSEVSSDFEAKKRKKGALCEDCGLVSRNYGLMSDNVRRWCMKCSKEHEALWLWQGRRLRRRPEHVQQNNVWLGHVRRRSVRRRKRSLRSFLGCVESERVSEKCPHSSEWRGPDPHSSEWWGRTCEKSGRERGHERSVEQT
eukprot:SAG11_NODE_2508_length_3271_cov_5.144388_2_plen_184_part_00